jgi:hypothetical protein
MLVANTEEKAYKNLFFKIIRLTKCLSNMIWSYIYNYEFKISVYKVVIMNVSQVYKDKRDPVLRYNLT